MNRASKLFSYAHKSKSRMLKKLIHIFLRIVYSCDLPLRGTIGTGLVLEHNGLGVVISQEAIIGNDCTVYQHVTIGGRNGYPTIGNRCIIYPNSVIVGAISIGDNCVIGANSFVNIDVDSNIIVAGNPAHIIRYKN